MNIEKDLVKDGIIVTEKIDTDIILKITKSISKKIVETFPNFGLNADDIFSKLFSLNMYKANMPEGMAEANYCYKNSSIYFNSHIANEDLEEFAIHECLHFLQEVKDENNNILKLGLSTYHNSKPIGTGLNEAAVQYISAKIIGIEPDFEKYYDINIFTPSPSYYPVECALLNELIYLVGEDLLFKSTYFSTDDFKNEIINRSSKKTFNKIQKTFDDILKFEEHIIVLNNKIFESNKENKFQDKVLKYREKIKNSFINCQNLIVKEFFDKEYKNINNLEELDSFRKRISKFDKYVGKVTGYVFYENYFIEMMNKLEHKSNVLENGGVETALDNTSNFVFRFLNKIKSIDDIDDIEEEKASLFAKWKHNRQAQVLDDEDYEEEETPEEHVPVEEIRMEKEDTIKTSSSEEVPVVQEEKADRHKRKQEPQEPIYSDIKGTEAFQSKENTRYKGADVDAQLDILDLNDL